jgi:hypothetical protein
MAKKDAIAAHTAGSGRQNKRSRVSLSEDVVLVAEELRKQDDRNSQIDRCAQIQAEKTHDGGGQGNQEPGRSGR